MPYAAPMFRHQVGGRSGGGGGDGYDQRRGSARQRGYTPAWDQASAIHRTAYPLCLGCQAVGRVVVCDVVDHIVPHKGDARLMWDAGNWQSACRWHHDTVKQQLERSYAAGKLTTADLRLDSAAAIALTRRLDP
jgi:5-methylcytosine-specific restriction endonuclease McrA